MLARVLARACLLLASVCLAACLYPDPNEYAGSCRFAGRDNSACGSCLVATCPADLDALCDGTDEAEYDLRELETCAPKRTCTPYSFSEPFSACLEKCTICLP